MATRRHRQPVIRGPCADIPTPRVFCRKSPDLLDGKGLEFFGSDKESGRVSQERS